MKYMYKAGLAFMVIVSVFGYAGAMEAEDCLGCHADIDTVGENLTIDADAFEHTVHAELGCVTCHDSITDEHPDDGKAVTNSSCRDCHEEIGTEYSNTGHADNASCRDCHDPHNAYGLEVLSSEDLNRQCEHCHGRADVSESHARWLPQADLHLAKLPCVTCHTSSENYEIVLHITQKKTIGDHSRYVLSNFEELKTASGAKTVERLIDVNGDHFISLAELRTFNLNPAYKKLRIEGTLIPSDVSHELSTLDNRYDCSFCHASGPDNMQTSYLSLPQENGTFARTDVEKGAVLDALYGTPDFYMTGSTRNASLNIIGLVIICGGFIMPIGHGALRFLTRKNRKS